MKGFREFLLQGNVVDLAVAVIIGAAFATVIKSFTEDMLTPLIAAFGGQPDFSALKFTINNSQFLYGSFINAVVAFVITAAIIYYLVVLPVTQLKDRRNRGMVTAPTTKTCAECLSEIPLAARRCAFCTVPVK
ncbi:large conductance mechanosensitive channel protein MscL [Nitrolancea hollandica]|uniref:Large-conductance mechanosensitive channel n=1 Tax=Nitrolancea hollandica Lb TaxID=1129897 RepID=I4EDY1_9BACT|nr:large conductance mechanosensitive channel protein MscL [Nitrolancea hollandica]CCF82893.1 Large-conductance mechanosensitive channel [Nitrolancea hollandica Lb]